MHWRHGNRLTLQRKSHHHGLCLRCFLHFSKFGLRVFFQIPSGKHTKNYGKSPCVMGQLFISMAIFNSFFFVYQVGSIFGKSDIFQPLAMWFPWGLPLIQWWEIPQTQLVKLPSGAWIPLMIQSCSTSGKLRSGWWFQSWILCSIIYMG